MKIERCVSEDIMRILELDSCIECAWSKDNFIDSFNNGITEFLKATDGEKILGYVGYDVILDEICINNIAVDAAYRRLGIGTELIKQVINNATETGKNRIFLEVNEQNISAIALYKKMGFELLAHRPNYYGKDKNAAVYVKNIAWK